MLLTWRGGSGHRHVIIMNIPSCYHQALFICAENEGHWQASLKQGHNSGSLSKVKALPNGSIYRFPSKLSGWQMVLQKPLVLQKFQGSHSLVFLKVMHVLQFWIFHKAVWETWVFAQLRNLVSLDWVVCFYNWHPTVWISHWHIKHFEVSILGISKVKTLVLLSCKVLHLLFTTSSNPWQSQQFFW